MGRVEPGKWTGWIGVVKVRVRVRVRVGIRVRVRNRVRVRVISVPLHKRIIFYFRFS